MLSQHADCCMLTVTLKNVQSFYSWITETTSHFVAWSILMRLYFINLVCLITWALGSGAYADSNGLEFDYSKVRYSTQVSGEWITVHLYFDDVSPMNENNFRNLFTIGLDGSLKKNEFHAIRMNNSFRIPDNLAYEGRRGQFYFADYTVRNNKFRKLYNSLTLNEQIVIQGACQFIASNAKDILDEAKAKDIYKQAKAFFHEQHAAKLTKLGNLCVEVSSRVYAKDLQAILTAYGFDLGKIDGKWGPKSQAAYGKFLNSRGLSPTTKPSIQVFNLMRKELGVEAPKLLETSNTSQFFSNKGEINGIVLSLDKKLAARKTINVFRAWHLSEGTRGYGLYWSSSVSPSKTAITLLTPLWNYYYPNESYNYRGVEKFYMKRTWKHDAEYGKTIPLDYRSPEYRDWFVGLVSSQIRNSKANGVMLDWWHDRHDESNGFSKSTVRKARHLLAEGLRRKFGSDFIIMGNVNWGDDTDVKYMNGVFMELYKNQPNRLHSSSELRKIERTMIRYEKELLPPKLIALEGWRQTSVNMGSKRNSTAINRDRNSPSNRKMAKLMTAMSAVIPSNGYILYADNNQDTSDGDHGHVFYDFYKFDIGKPISDHIKIKNGVGLKYFEEGFIGYNITGQLQSIETNDRKKIAIEQMSGLFCKKERDDYQCLINN